MKRNLHHSHGSSLLLVLTVFVILSACVGMAFNYTQTISRQVQRTVSYQRAQEVGDGALELAFSSWREICRSNASVPLPTNYFDTAIPLPTAASFPTVTSFTASRTANPSSGTPFTLANFRVQAVDPQLSTNTAGDSTLATDAVPPIATGRNPANTNTYYLASADVSLPIVTKNKYVATKVRRIFRKETKSPWEHAIFYTDELEMHPGPSFIVNGPVHTNGNLYTAHSSLTFGDKVTYGNSWSINFSPQDARYGSETPGSPSWPSNLPPASGSIQQPLGLDSSKLFNAVAGNQNDDGYREIIERPVTSQADPMSDTRVYNQAGVKILVDASNVVTIKRRTSSGGETTVTASSTGSDKQIYDTFSKAVSTGTSIQDNREGASVRLVNVDMGKVSQAMSGSALTGTGFNGILYVADTSADPAGGTPKRGVRLLNGATMPLGGITVATENPLYIQGDYNTGSTAILQPLSNAGDSTQPTVLGYTRQPCAVMADAVNILSNAWSDANSILGTNSRIATPTTVNTAILSGNVPSKNGVYSGGVENFPRFLEDWTNRSFTYYGSMVEMFASQQSDGSWGAGNVYAAPLRRWYFDTNFLSQPPKGIATLITYYRDKWFLE